MQFKPSDKEQIIPFDRLTFDPRLQMRVFVSDETVDKYADDMKERKSKFPALKACIDPEGVIWVYDGWHTAEAKKALKHPGAAVLLEAGTFDDAFLKAAGSNSDNARQRTAEDEMKAAYAVCSHPEYGRMSNPRIAEACNVSENVVRKARTQIEFEDAAQRVKEEAAKAQGKPPPKKKATEPKRIVGRHGRNYPAKRPRAGKVKVRWAEFHRCGGVRTRFQDDMYRQYGKVTEAGAIAEDATYEANAKALDTFVRGVKARYKQLAKEPAPEA